jgi:hypothetical protein
MNSNEIKHLIDECKTIDENCLYTAQTHFEMARAAQWKVHWLVSVPSLLAVIAGFYSAMNDAGWAGAIAAAAAGLAGLASVLGIEKDVVTHKSAGNLMTSLRHDARVLHECYWQEMTREQFYIEIRRLNDRYRIARLALEPTDNAAFEKARKRIKQGYFKPDFQETQRNEATGIVPTSVGEGNSGVTF